MGATSVLMLGDGRADADALEALVGGPPARFFALAQRCVWGLSQADLVKVDVPTTLKHLGAEFPRLFLTHLLSAFALRATAPGRATECLERARGLAASDHPWRYLLPSDAEWAAEVPRQALHEVIADRVWRVRIDVPMAGTPFHIASQATLIRSERGEIVIINPVDFCPEVRREVGALGKVSALVTQGRAHSRYVNSTRAMFPEARVLGSKGHTLHPASSHLRFDGLLGTESSMLGDEFVELPIEGTEADEVVLVHRPTRLLVAQDLVANGLARNTARPFAGRLEYFVFGLSDRIGLLSYHPMLWNDLGRFQATLERVLATPYDLVTAAHWSSEPVGGADRAAFDEALSFVLSLSGFEHKRLVARYFWSQPGFLYDLLRYSLRANK